MVRGLREIEQIWRRPKISMVEGKRKLKKGKSVNVSPKIPLQYHCASKMLLPLKMRVVFFPII